MINVTSEEFKCLYDFFLTAVKLDFYLDKYGKEGVKSKQLFQEHIKAYKDAYMYYDRKERTK